MRRLSYADRWLLASLAIALIVGLVASCYVFSVSYRLAASYSESGVLYVSDEIYYVNVARKILENVFGGQVNESLYSDKIAEDYYNLEHPPLGKYIIMASIALCGDRPLCWRLPGVLEASLSPLLLSLGLWAALRRAPWWIRGLAPAAGALALAADPVLARAGSVAMLDIHLAFFTLLSLLALANGRVRLAIIAGGLAASVKFSGVASLIAVPLAILAHRGARPASKAFGEAVILGLLVYAIINVPLALYFGPAKLVDETLAALRWHTTPRPEGPPTSTPIGWVLNSNPFYYTFSPGPVPATLNTPIHLMVIVSLPVIVMVSWRRCLPAAAAALTYTSIIAVYLLVMALGNNTLYSFYSVQLSPAAGATIASLVALAGGGCVEASLPRGGETQGP